MESMEEPKEEESSEEAKEAKTHMEEEHMDGTREETKEETKEKEKEDLWESATCAARKGTAHDSVQRRDRKEERKGRAKASKDRAIIAVSSDTVQRTAGRQVKAKEAKEEYMQLNGKEKEKMRKRKKAADG